MNEENLIKHYNKHNEDKRLKTKHAQVEFITAMKYIHEYIKPGAKVLDVGAAMGAYSVPLHEEGYDVTAFELVKHNLKEIEIKCPNIKCIQGNAINLSKLEDYVDDTIVGYAEIILDKEIYHKEPIYVKKEVKKEKGSLIGCLRGIRYVLMSVPAAGAWAPQDFCRAPRLSPLRARALSHACPPGAVFPHLCGPCCRGSRCPSDGL